MSNALSKAPQEDTALPRRVRTAVELGNIVRSQRQEMRLRQIDLAGIGNTGNRLIVDIEKGKPTVQLQKVLDLLDLLGLDVIIKLKSSRML